MPYADLHVHTTRSDGSLELEDVPAAARRAGVAVVALTDHDRCQPFDEPAIERDGVTILHGIELRVEVAGGSGRDEADSSASVPPLRVDLLGYGIRPTAALETALEELQRNRRERGRAIVDRVEEHLDVELDVAVELGFGRPHVARAVDAHPGTEYDYQGTFDDLIGAGCPCYVPRQIPSFERGRQLLADAGELVSLAHPLRYPNPDRALEAATALDAIEVQYPYGRDVDLAGLERFVEQAGLATTGGSDAHDARLGEAGLSKAAYRALGVSDL